MLTIRSLAPIPSWIFVNAKGGFDMWRIPKSAVKFNSVPVGTVFHHPNVESWVFVKIANADPTRPPDAQAPNCVKLDNHHYCALHAGSPIVIIKEPDDYDDSKLSIV